jgi:hypothetical protein
MGDRVFVPETSNPVERALLNYTPYLWKIIDNHLEVMEFKVLISL